MAHRGELTAQCNENFQPLWAPKFLEKMLPFSKNFAKHLTVAVYNV